MQSAPTSPTDWIVILPVILPLLGAALLLVLGSRIAPPIFAFAVTLVVGVAECGLLQHVLTAGPLSMTMGRWLPPFGISFTADAIGAGLALTAAVVTLVVLVYAQENPAETEPRPALYALVLLLLAGVNGAFLTGDLFNLYVWFEVMLIASFGLLAVSGTPQSLDATVKYGLINFIGTSLFLLALGLLYGALGTLNMADIIGKGAAAPPAIMASIAALLLVAFGIKSAAFPVNAWLPASYHTPPAVISALFGGLLTKAGVYALLRILVLLLPLSRDLLQPVIALIAGATLILAPLAALAETNLRRAIGYFLIGGIGATLAGIALPNLSGIGGATVYIVYSMLTISGLYLVAGTIERLTAETDIGRMGGLYARHTLLAILFLLLVVTVAGVPPFLGFWPKLLLLQGAIERMPDAAALPLAACLLLNAFLTLIAGGRLWLLIFWRDRPQPKEAGQELAPLGPSRGKVGLGAAAFLTLLILLAGLWPAPLLSLGHAAAAGLLDPSAYIAAVGLGGGQ
ncbi:MAG TPA: proton-conducting transporter membrane subunit [Devosiaceae bacterium]|nr:proton-conducting transporter membrane subunit [Devosiaceae bacterium]